MKTILNVLMLFIAGTLLVAFGAGIFLAAHYSLPNPPRPDDMPKIVSYFVSSVNGTLAANLGMLLGISISPNGWRKPSGGVEWMQWLAGIVYVVMLIVAVVLWGRAGFTEDTTNVVAVLPEIAKHGVGILIAILATVLGVQTAITRARGG